MAILRLVFSVAAAIPLLALVLSFAGRLHWGLDLLAQGRGQTAILVLAFAPVLILCNAWRIGLVLMIAGVAGLVSVLPIQTPETPAEDVTLYRMAHFNISFRNEQQEEVVAWLTRGNYDFVTLVEVSRAWHPSVREIARAFRYDFRYVTAPDGAGLAFFSRYPLREPKIVQVAEGNRPVLRVEVNAPTGTFTAFVVHPISPRTAEQFAQRNAFYEAFIDIVNGVEQPVLVVGDFNSTPWSPFLQDFQRATGLRWLARPLDFPATWPVRNPFLRIPIDHAFSRPAFPTRHYQVWEDMGSDHLPIEFSFALPE